MNYQKNDVLTVKIEDMGHDGEGIGKCEGYTLFVKDTVIGDLAEVKVIKAKKNYGYARLMRLIEPSAHRVEPVCPVARPCGGCQLQMLDYASSFALRRRKSPEISSASAAWRRSRWSRSWGWKIRSAIETKPSFRSGRIEMES